MSLIIQKIEAAGGALNPTYAENLGDNNIHQETSILDTFPDGSYRKPDDRDWKLMFVNEHDATVSWQLPRSLAKAQAGSLQEEFEAEYQGN